MENVNEKEVQTTENTEQIEEKVEKKEEEKVFSQKELNSLLAKQKRDFQKQINELKMLSMSDDEKVKFINEEEKKTFENEKAEFEKMKSEFTQRQNKLIAYEKCAQLGIEKGAVDLINFSLIKEEKDIDKALENIQKSLNTMATKMVDEKIKTNKVDFKEVKSQNKQKSSDIFKMLNDNKIIK